MYALLTGYLLCNEVNVIIYARSGALGGGRTHTWRILSPSWELSSCQNIGQLSVAQARVLAIVRMCMHLCMHS